MRLVLDPGLPRSAAHILSAAGVDTVVRLRVEGMRGAQTTMLVR